MYQRLYQEGTLPLEKLITREYPLDMINEAVADLEAGKVARAVIALASPPARQPAKS
jgi:Zn-dependent alcohol dehydrogenase